MLRALVPLLLVRCTTHLAHASNFDRSHQFVPVGYGPCFAYPELDNYNGTAVITRGFVCTSVDPTFDILVDECEIARGTIASCAAYHHDGARCALFFASKVDHSNVCASIYNDSSVAVRSLPAFPNFDAVGDVLYWHGYSEFGDMYESYPCMTRS
eukprot:gene32172-40702_t